MDPATSKIRLSDALEQRLAELARVTGETPLQVLGRAIEVLETALRQTGTKNGQEAAAGSVLDQWSRAGLIGCAKGLPADLSTNPKYMEDFGRD